MNKIWLFVCVSCVLVTTFATSMVWKARMPGDAQQIELQPSIPVSEPERISTATAEIELFKEHIAKLEERLHEKEDEIAKLKDDLTNEADNRLLRTPKAKTSYLSKVKKEDPERAERIRTRLTEMNEKTTRSIAESAAFLFNLDMASMTEEQAENHRELLRLMEDSWKLSDEMKDNPDPEEAKQARNEIRKNVMAMRKAYKTERQAALNQWIVAQGFQPEETDALRKEIEEVLTRTDPSNVLPNTHFVSDSVMISLDAAPEGENTQSITLELDAAFEIDGEK